MLLYGRNPIRLRVRDVAKSPAVSGYCVGPGMVLLNVRSHVGSCSYCTEQRWVEVSPLEAEYS